MKAKLTSQQKRVLDAIRQRMDQGEPVPTYRELCKEFGWSSTATVRDHLQALAQKGYVQLSGSTHRQTRLVHAPPAAARVPLVGRIVAGTPVLAEENVEDHLPVPPEWITRGDYFALRVSGDSMVNAGILEGDYVVVRQQETANDGDVVVAALEGETTLKRLRWEGEQRTLVAENPRYLPIPIQTEAVVVQGVVVGLLRDFQGHGRRDWIAHAVSRGQHKRQDKPPQGRRI